LQLDRIIALDDRERFRSSPAIRRDRRPAHVNAPVNTMIIISV
jgi:hypothetical protein